MKLFNFFRKAKKSSTESRKEVVRAVERKRDTYTIEEMEEGYRRNAVVIRLS